jgi:nitrogen fixation/metabolism regulation signal transduction histidine kinase
VVRDFRRLMAASPTLHEALDLAQVIADLVRTLQVELTRQDVQVIFKTQAVQVRGDRLQLQTAVGGILFFLVQRERQQPLQVLMSTNPSGRFVALGVLDDGPPLTEALYTQALDHMNTDMHSPFSRSLWLGRAIVEHHGGTMRLHEEDGQTGIQVMLPIWEKDQ